MRKMKRKYNKLGLFCGVAFCLVCGMPALTMYAVPEKANATSWLKETRTLADIDGQNMQDMNGEICRNSKIGDSATLIDVRDGSDYTVSKLADGKCWMTQNLRLAGGSKLTPEDSNVNVEFMLPSSTDVFPPSTDPAIGYMKNSTDNVYGAYYSYNAATAGSALDISMGNAPYDICAKEWRLPNSMDYSALFSKYPGNSNPGAFETNSGRNGFWLGAASAAAGGAFFYASGFINGSGINVSVGADGMYRSSTVAYDGLVSYDYAYTLRFTNRSIAHRSTEFRFLDSLCVA